MPAAIDVGSAVPFVLDNSVCAGWVFDNQSNGYTAAVAKHLAQEQAVVPPIWELELCNLLRTACRRGTLQAQRAQALLQTVLTLPIGVDRDPMLPSEVLALALRFSLSCYDAAYLGLALRRQLPIATRDEALVAAATASGVGVLELSG